MKREKMTEIQKHEDLKQCAIFSYGKTKGKQPREIHSVSSSCSGSYPVSSYTRADGTHVSAYTRTCYIHGGNVLRSYLGKAVKDMNEQEVNELLEDYI